MKSGKPSSRAQNKTGKTNPRRKKAQSKRSRYDQIEVVYEDEDMIVVNKPAGLLSVPIPKSNAINLHDLLKDYLMRKGQQSIRVHRIDRFTSGLVVFAKNRESRYALVGQFRAHSPKRTYHCWVRGVPKVEQATLTHHMRQIKEGFRNLVCSPDAPGAAPCWLDYKVLKNYNDKASLLEVNLITGLKNQIRVQFAAIGNPIIGDRHYSREEKETEILDRQALHSFRLELKHPKTENLIVLEAKYPKDLGRLDAFLNNNL